MNRKQIIRDKLANKKELISIKRATVKHTEGLILTPKLTLPSEGVNKAELPSDTDEILYRTIIANTYNYMDSHDDVHLNGCFAKSIQENKRQLYIKDHANYTTEMAGKVLKAYELMGTFKSFGYDSDLSTMALLKDVAIYKEQSEQFFSQMANGMINQHSVGMMYIKIALAVDDIQDQEAYKLYTSLLPMIGNSKEVEEQGYFFAVQEAKELETSAATMGSNSLTGIYNDNTKDYNEDDIDKIIQTFGNIDKFDKLYQNYVKTRTNKAVIDDTLDKKKSFMSMINTY